METLKFQTFEENKHKLETTLLYMENDLTKALIESSKIECSLKHEINECKKKILAADTDGYIDTICSLTNDQEQQVWIKLRVYKTGELKILK